MSMLQWAKMKTKMECWFWLKERVGAIFNEDKNGILKGS